MKRLYYINFASPAALIKVTKFLGNRPTKNALLEGIYKREASAKVAQTSAWRVKDGVANHIQTLKAQGAPKETIKQWEDKYRRMA